MKPKLELSLSTAILALIAVILSFILNMMFIWGLVKGENVWDLLKSLF